MKKILLFSFMLLFAFHAVGFAAVSGSKAKPSAPASRPSTTQTAPSTGYKPSAPANSYTEKAPAAKTAAQQAPAQTSGGFMRNLGLFGGGMLLGCLLGNMFGFGHSGMFANMMGILFNIVFLAAIFMAGRYLWDKFRNNSRR